MSDSYVKIPVEIYNRLVEAKRKYSLLKADESVLVKIMSVHSVTVVELEESFNTDKYLSDANKQLTREFVQQAKEIKLKNDYIQELKKELEKLRVKKSFLKNLFWR